MRKYWATLGAAAKVVIVAGLAGFAVRLSSTTISGGECSYIDVGALGAGVVCGLAGIAALVMKPTATVDADMPVPIDRIIGVVGIALGIIHIMRGTGAIGGPC